MSFTENCRVMKKSSLFLSFILFFIGFGLQAQRNSRRLIDIRSLEQLDAIRYDLDGNGEVDETTDAAGQAAYRRAFALASDENNTCRGGCKGYELINDLDFAGSKWENPTNGTYTSDRVAGGWVPIDGDDPVSRTPQAPYNAVFDGKGHTISGLYIQQSERPLLGLFGYTGDMSRVLRLGLLNVGITGNKQFARVGGIAGINEGDIIACYVSSGTISGNKRGTYIGGIVGKNGDLADRHLKRVAACYARATITGGKESYVGGLVGQNQGKVSASYATGNLRGGNDSYVGGLVGENRKAIACYATGNVRGGKNSHIGGLVGYNRGELKASYATGKVLGMDAKKGGIIGFNHQFGTNVKQSYFDVTLRSELHAIGVGNRSGPVHNTAFAKMTTELQSTTTYTGIYEEWNVDFDGTASRHSDEMLWDLGTSSKYPALKLELAAASVASSLSSDADLLSFGVSTGSLTPLFSSQMTAYILSVPQATSSITLRPVMSDSSTASLSYAPRGMIDGSGYRFELSRPTTTITITVTVEDSSTKSYTITVRKLGSSPTTHAPNLIDITNLEQLNAIRYDLNGDGMADNPAHVNFYNGASAPFTRAQTSCTPGPCIGYELRADLDFNDKDKQTAGEQLSVWAAGAVDGAVSGAVTRGWVSVGDDSDPFTSTFDGRGHTIYNLYMNRNTLDYLGLFGVLGAGGEIHNLGIERGSVRGTKNATQVGLLLGENRGTIKACYVTGNSTGGNHVSVGSFVGKNDGHITACYATGSSTGGNHASVGDFVGKNDGHISACYATGSGTGGDHASVGGLVGENDGKITACYATASARGEENAKVGGLVGANHGQIHACYATWSAAGGERASVGGLVGENGNLGTISSSYFDSDMAILTVSSTPLAMKLGVGSDLASSALGKSTTQLQYPTSYNRADAAFGGMAIYSDWNLSIGGNSNRGGGQSVWDFGTNQLYPKLRVDFDRDATPTVAEFGCQRFYFSNTDEVEMLSLFVAENMPPAVALVYVKALEGKGNFRLTSDNFEIESNMGAISLKSTADIDFDDPKKNSFVLNIEATTEGITTHLVLRVKVTEADQVSDTIPPVFTYPAAKSSFSFEVPENASSGTTISTIRATDNVSSMLRYSLLGDHSTDFSIERDGRLRVAGVASLDRSARSSYMLTVRVADEANNTAEAAINIRVTGNADSLAFGLVNAKVLEARLYPHPASSRVHVLGLETENSYVYELYDLHAHQLRAMPLSDEHTINLESFSAGTYVLIVRLENGKEVLQTKCIINK